MEKSTSHTNELKTIPISEHEMEKEGRFKEILSRYFTPKESISKTESKILATLPFVLLLIFWSALTYSGILPTVFLPTPTAVLATVWELFAEQQFIVDIGTSFFRILVGYVLAAVLAVPLGILMGSYSGPRSFFEPIIGIARYLPVTALIPLFILWMGIGETEKIAVIFFGTFFPLVFLIMDVSSNVSKDLLNVSYTLGANRRKLFTSVLVPACMPGVVDNLRSVLGWTWTYLIVAELVAAETGIGHVIMTAQRYLNTGQIIGGVIIIGLLGFFSDFLFAKLYRKLFPYVKR
ncbi:ABC transporter permease [Metabacillus litoralis]|uniref:ABC transporter permease n=1 Tax=Metabacillus TaxID=2675233 RepID=UPI001E5B58B3|nr:ABC transporter permease [Metabacillus litoralis]MCM3161039.1 ABC transporter permease [Metabacillus litoralis]MCM3412987.1 ABC transporter permease [Metabacillus litoralis]UHA62071.1 ABC transporter permease [Metabacillus litoralis]